MRFRSVVMQKKNLAYQATINIRYRRGCVKGTRKAVSRCGFQVLRLSRWYRRSRHRDWMPDANQQRTVHPQRDEFESTRLHNVPILALSRDTRSVPFTRQAAPAIQSADPKSRAEPGHVTTPMAATSRVDSWHADPERCARELDVPYDSERRPSQRLQSENCSHARDLRNWRQQHDLLFSGNKGEDR